MPPAVRTKICLCQPTGTRSLVAPGIFLISTAQGTATTEKSTRALSKSLLHVEVSTTTPKTLQYTLGNKTDPNTDSDMFGPTNLNLKIRTVQVQPYPI
jgi:hypothetical protein